MEEQYGIDGRVVYFTLGNRAVFRQLTVFALVVFSTIKTAVAEPLDIVISSYPPFSYQHAPNSSESFITKKIIDAFAAVDIEVNFHFVDWSENIESARGGLYDASAFWFCDQQRQQQFICSEPLSFEKIVLMHRKGESLNNWHSLLDLSAYRIGAIRSFTYTSEFWSLTDRSMLDIRFADSDQENIKRLLNGDVDVILVSEIVASYLLDQEFNPSQRERLAVHYRPFIRGTTHLLFPRGNAKSEALVALFNQGLQTIK